MEPLNCDPPFRVMEFAPLPRLRFPLTTPVAPFVKLTATLPPLPMTAPFPDVPAWMVPLLLMVFANVLAPARF